MPFFQNSEKVVRTRAGIHGREYHSTLYQIAKTNKRVTAEGASPLQTFFEAMQSNTNLQNFRDEIRISFTNTLRELIYKDAVCRDLCEIIEYNGIDIY